MLLSLSWFLSQTQSMLWWASEQKLYCVAGVGLSLWCHIYIGHVCTTEDRWESTSRYSVCPSTQVLKIQLCMRLKVFYLFFPHLSNILYCIVSNVWMNFQYFHDCLWHMAVLGSDRNSFDIDNSTLFLKCKNSKVNTSLTWK